MRKVTILESFVFFCFAWLALATPSFAQDDSFPVIDWQKKLTVDDRLTSFGHDLMGDTVDTHLGSIVFSHTDVSLPGNSNLEVVARRKLTQGYKYDWGTNIDFGDWILDIPRITAITSASKGWAGQRCSGSWHENFPAVTWARRISSGNWISGIVESSGYTNGVSLEIPGQGAQEVLKGTSNRPGVAYTVNEWYLSCTTASDGGQGFIAQAPNGNKYYFTRFVERPYKRLGFANQGPSDIGRRKSMFLATKVEDVHGNWVNYVYDSSNRLTDIQANDGRHIEFDYTDLMISKITANGREWRYAYRNSTHQTQEWEIHPNSTYNGKVLSRVTLPDSQYWDFTLDGMQAEASPCAGGFAGSSGGASAHPLVVKHPNGTVGTFNLLEKQHRQAFKSYTSVIRDCIGELDREPDAGGSGPTSGQGIPPLFEVLTARTISVVSKTLSHSSTKSATWTFSYEDPDECYGLPAGVCPNSPGQDITRNPNTNTDPFANCAFCFGSIHNVAQYVQPSPAHLYRGQFSPLYVSDAIYSQFNDDALDYTNHTTVTQPDGSQINYYHLWEFEEMFGGKEILRTISKDGVELERVETTYSQFSCNGSTAVHKTGANSNSAECPTHVTKTKIQRNGDQFFSETDYKMDAQSSDYSYGHPIETRSWSSYVISGESKKRITHTTYEHKADKWILGLPKTVRRNGRLLSSTDYTPLGQAHKRYQYSQTTPVATYSYHSDGTVASMTDAVGRRTEAHDWHRGKPERVERAVGTPLAQSIGRELDDNGWIKSQTDAKGRTTSYQHDSMGRLTRITPHSPPSGQGSKLPDTTIQYFFGDTNIQMITTGRKRNFVYYDSLFRPVNELTIDFATDERIWTRTRYDSLSRIIFNSHPSRVPWEASGTETEYDGLGRVMQTRETTSNAITSHEYLSGHRYKVTDAEGHATITTRYGYEGPDAGDSYLIAQPEGINTYTYRNVHGEITRARQLGTSGGFSVDQSQYYYYDGQYRLCRHRNLEGGNTVYQYNAANELTAYQKGLPPGASCSTPAGTAKVSLTYDDLGRLVSTDYADPATPDIWRDYDANGNITKLYRGSGASAVNWDYSYDGNDMLTSEELVIAGAPEAFDIRYLYNGYGQMYRKYLPSGKGISYTNDGLGRHTKVSWGTATYAQNASYHPNGAVESLTFGNGQVFTQTLNARLLPYTLQVTKGGNTVQDLQYDYDKNARVAYQTNHLNSDDTRFYQYDGAGRLKQANSGRWGQADYSYDALGNLRSKHFSGWKNSGPRTVTNNYNSWNRIASSIDTANIGYGFNYDSRGNIRTTGLLNFSYDMSDQPIAMSGRAPNTGTQIDASYLYDGNMKRVKSVVNGKTIYNVYDAAGRLVHVDEHTDGKETDYLHGMGQTLARIKNGEFTYLHPDHLGSPQVGTTEAGALAFTESYSPYGEALLSPAANDNQSGFTGHIKDKSTGLNYMQARYYDPNIGRFLSIDPVTFMDTGDTNQFNRYVYGNNDPVNMLDPNGQDAITVRFKDQVIRTDSGRAVPQTLSRGHSGIIAIRNDGLTRYREYGRYPGGGEVDGAVRRPTISDLNYKDGVPTVDSLRNVLSDVLDIGAANGSSELQITVDTKADDFDAMMTEVDRWDNEVEYNWTNGQTCHGMCEAVRQEGGGGQGRITRGVFGSSLTADTLDETAQKLHDKWEDVVK